ncbi:discoidin domain-containing protein [Micromonosporaceae bacterium Da 78-11]
MCLLVGTAVALHHRPAAAPAADPHAGHLVPQTVPVAVTQAAPLPRTGWTVTADNAQASAAAVLDGKPATYWKTAATALPHTLTVDTHNRIALGGLTYLPPAGSPDGRIGQYKVQISDNGITWGAPVASGTFADDAVLKTITINTVVTRYVRLSALSEAGNRGTWSAAAEINLLGGTDPPLPRTGWTASADSQEKAWENDAAANAIDGNTASIWHTVWSTRPVPALPHRFVIDMHATNLVSGLTYLPRLGASRNGLIGKYRIETSVNGAVWGPVLASGSFLDKQAAQTVTFASSLARFVRLTALSEAGNRGPWSTAAEINLLGRANPTLSRAGWIAKADSQETARQNGRAGNVLDGNAATMWHTVWSRKPLPKLPHTLTIDLRKNVSVGGLTYLPRPATSPNGRVGRYRIATSTNGTAWTYRITNGAFADSPALQTVVFPPVTARYVRLTAVTEARNRGPWTTAAEINLLGPSGSLVPQRGTWSAPVGFPLVPVAAALLPNGKILTWSAFQSDNYVGGRGRTLTATYDPRTGVVTQRTVTETGHDMFCPGIATLPDGRILVMGGNNSEKTSIYDPGTDAWTSGADMTTPRGYQAATTLSDGRIFTVGGSWSGGYGGYQGSPHKAGEVWSAQTGWTALPGADAAPMLTGDKNPVGDYRKDNHAWLFAWTGDKVLQAGPSRAMNWYSTDGDGSVTPAGNRGDDKDAMNGNAVMFDTGKILTVGGAPSYENNPATANAYVVSIDGTNVTTRKVASMANTRAFHNSVALPDGKVAVFGGQNYPVPFSDNTAVLSAELWDPVSESFSTMAIATGPRTYHSVALLMPDGRVFTGGGGLCGTGCAANHFDGQIFTPPNLLSPDGSPAPRPSLTGAPATAGNGSTINVTTDRPVTAFAIIRMGTATHSVNTDQRRLSLVPTPGADGGYDLTIPADPGIALPGYWMLFAMDAKGVPSIARTIRIG